MNICILCIKVYLTAVKCILWITLNSMLFETVNVHCGFLLVKLKVLTVDPCYLKHKGLTLDPYS